MKYKLLMLYINIYKLIIKLLDFNHLMMHVEVIIIQLSTIPIYTITNFIFLFMCIKNT